MKKMVFRKLSVPSRPSSTGWHHQRAIVLTSQAGDLVTPLPKGVMEYDDRGGGGESNGDGDMAGNSNEPYFTAINAAESSIRSVFAWWEFFNQSQNMLLKSYQQFCQILYCQYILFGWTRQLANTKYFLIVYNLWDAFGDISI